MAVAEIDALIAAIKQKAPPGVDIVIPPRVFEEMGAEIIDFERNAYLTVRVPALDRYSGPLGAMQGGMIGAAFDNAYGPFSYLVAKRPCVTKTMDTMFIRPIKAGDDALIVRAELLAKTRSLLFLQGRATNEAGKLVATSTTTMVILQHDQLANMK